MRHVVDRSFVVGGGGSDLMPAILTGTCDCQSNDAAKRCNCSAKQTENAEKIIDFMQDKRMADWIVIKPLYCKPATPLAGNKVYC